MRDDLGGSRQKRKDNFGRRCGRADSLGLSSAGNILAGEYTLDFYCPLARLSVELDGFGHGLPRQRQVDFAKQKFLASQGIEELRFWNRQWRENREGVLLEIWHPLHQRTGCVQIMRKMENNRYRPPDPKLLLPKPPKPKMWFPPGTAPRLEFDMRRSAVREW